MEKRQVLRPNFEKRGGLVVVVVQSVVGDEEVLMVAYANEEAWRKTLRTGMATMYSTSRQKLWTKGEESGNFMKIVEVRVDCDGDALLYVVEPQGDGLACHTGAHSCFYRSGTGDGLDHDAPKAGIDEYLPLAEVELHDDLL